MSSRRIVFLSLVSLWLAAPAAAQELSVKGSGSFNILQSQNTSTASEDRVAVLGLSKPVAYYGVGGKFEGGYQGIISNATMGGTGSRYGGSFFASGGTSNYGIYASAATGTAWAGFFSGNVYVSGTVTQASDAKLKMNIQELPNGTLDLVLKLKPKNYRYRQNASPKLNLPDGEQVGLIAQEVAAVFPNLVKEVEVPSDDKSKPAEKVLSVDYVKLVPHLIKAVQELHAQVAELKAQLASQAGR